LFLAETEAIAAKAEFDGVAEGRPADGFNQGAVAEAHLQQATPAFRVTGDGHHSSAVTDR
jgi:hypothetical protein